MRISEARLYFFFFSLYSVNEVISYSSPLCRSVPEGVALAQPEAAAFIQAQAHAVGAVVAPERLAGAAAVPHDVPDVNMVAGAGNVNAGGADLEGAGMVAAAAVVTEREGVDRRNGGDLQENWGRGGGGGGHAATGMLGEAESTLDVNAAASGIDAMDLVTSDMERDYLQQHHHHLHQNHNQRRSNNQFGRNERVGAPFE